MGTFVFSIPAAFIYRPVLKTHYESMIVAPICTELPFKAGADLSENRVAAEIHSFRMTTAVNMLDLPAVTLPVGIADGLPQAVQAIGPRCREDLCLDAGQAIEASLGIITPSIHARRQPPRMTCANRHGLRADGTRLKLDGRRAETS
jgi:Asp-tRNA(Asn)/Glu-tRNA(Gln) amidotransferase A subunit family amidase